MIHVTGKTEHGASIVDLQSWFENAPPAGGAAQWEDYRSAKELARAWCDSGIADCPYELNKALNGHPATRGLQLSQLQLNRDLRMQVSVETIYAWIKANRKQGGQVYGLLRQSTKKRRRRYGTGVSRRSDPTKKPMEQRPVSAHNRSRLGHWESDTIEGQKGTGYLVTHVERKTGFLVASYLPNKKAETLNATSVRAFKDLPSSLIRTLTTDNGSEFSGHRELEQLLSCSVYFTPARQPRQRGQNENTNGLLRQYFPKGSDFRKLTEEEVQIAVAELNHRPRKKYQFKSPHELLMSKTRALHN